MSFLASLDTAVKSCQLAAHSFVTSSTSFKAPLFPPSRATPTLESPSRRVGTCNGGSPSSIFGRALFQYRRLTHAKHSMLQQTLAEPKALVVSLGSSFSQPAYLGVTAENTSTGRKCTPFIMPFCSGSRTGQMHVLLYTATTPR